MSRKDKWKTPTYLLTFLAGDDKTWLDQVSNRQTEASKESYTGKPDFSHWWLLGACKELIFDVRDGKPYFHAIMYSLDADKVCIKLESMFEMFEDSDEPDEIDDFVRRTLALSYAQEIPVYPDTEELGDLLASYHKKMLIDGFTAPDGHGGRARLTLISGPGKKIIDPTYIKRINATEYVAPSDITLIKGEIEREFDRVENTRRLLLSLRSAIGGLKRLLEPEVRNENEIQEFLTQNPMLFGVEYVRVIPKHQLGAEFKMDYAIERQSGAIDLVEIESPSLPLFNKKGDASRYLVHAEQQVMDWISWVEKNSPYARESLPGLMAPVGYVIIGRGSSIDSNLRLKLNRRNLMFRGQLVIMTYDDLLERARIVIGRLEGT